MTGVNPFRSRPGAKPRAAFLALISMLTLSGGLVVVVAANRFAVVGVENGTHVAIRMQHKWGDGPWASDVLQPGGRKWFWHTYDRPNEDRSPTFRVQFDSDLSPGKVFNIPYELKKNAAPAHEWENARRYIFRYDGGTKFIDLREQ
jgi:hypothetical protein